MKKILFVDNDDLKRATEDICYIQQSLEMYSNVKEEYINNIEIEPVS